MAYTANRPILSRLAISGIDIRLLGVCVSGLSVITMQAALPAMRLVAHL